MPQHTLANCVFEELRTGMIASRFGTFTSLIHEDVDSTLVLRGGPMQSPPHPQRTFQRIAVRL